MNLDKVDWRLFFVLIVSPYHTWDAASWLLLRVRHSKEHGLILVLRTVACVAREWLSRERVCCWWMHY